MRKLILGLVTFIIFKETLQSQQCFSIQPKTYGIPCGSNCVNLSFKIPNYKSTEDYVLKSIPYQPSTFVTAGGIEENALYDDDRFSNKYPIGFPFCFFGDKYEKIVIGSNCVVTFDTTNATISTTCSNNWSIGSGPNIIPHTGGTQCSSSGGYIPRASILAPFHDIEPTNPASPSDRKIEWRVEGNAPCRKFVISFYKIPHFVNSTCIGFLNTSQIVLYEKTGFVEVFIKDKTICTASGTNNTSSTGGRAIFGIQNWARDKAVTDPAKNPGIWSETNQGYRFQPNGATNLLQSVIIKKKNGTVVGNGSIGAVANDSVTITYNNYCLGTSQTNDTLVVEANYTTCTGNAADDYTLVDTIYIEKNPGDLLASFTTTPAICLSSNGSLTVNVPSGAGVGPYQFSLNGAPFVNTNTFTGLASGTYTVYVKDATICTDTLTINVPLTNPVSATSTTIAPSCSGASNGSLTIVPSNATAPINYSLNGGATQTSPTFTGLAAGTYNVTISDANGCNRSVFVTVPAGSGTITGTLAVTPTTCPGATNGSITANGTTGTAPYEYAIGAAGAFGNSNVFSNLASGVYVIRIKDANGCIVTYNANVTNGPGVSATTSITAATCTGINNGSITVNATNGTTPYQYSLNGGANVPTNVFSNLAPGNYSIRVTDDQGCNVTINATVGTGPGVNATSSIIATTCTGVSNGSITINASGGVTPYSYSLDGGVPQAGNTFTNVSAGNHTILITDNVGCNRTLNVNVGTGTGINATATTTATSCTGVNNGSITITPTNGTAPYSYSLDGGNPQPGNIFTNVSAGNHTILVTDFLGCNRTINVTIAVGTGINASAATTPTSCSAISNGTITITPSNGTAPYSYSLDGGATQSSNTFNNVSSGNHSVMVTDFLGCTRTINVTVAAGVVFTLNQTSTVATCAVANNGSATINVTGGATPFQYAIDGGANQASPTFNNLSAGPHSVLVTDGAGCTNTINFTIGVGPGISANATTSSALCNGASNGSITLTPSNGNTPYSYQLGTGLPQLSNTFNGLAAGNYSIIVTDGNGCTTTVNTAIGEPTLLSASATTTPVLCNGQSNGIINVSASGGTPGYTYSIDNGVNFINTNTFNVAVGNYTIIVKDANGCLRNVTANVTQPNVLTASASSTNSTCNGGADGVITTAVNGGVGPYTYSLNGGTFQNGNTFNVVAGNYTVTVKDVNNCTATTNVLVMMTSNIILNTRNDTTICESKSVTLTTLSNGASFAWTPAASLNDSTLQNPTATPQVTTKYYVTATLGNCSTIDSVTIFVNAAPIANAGPDATICFGQTHTLQGSGGVQYVWLPSSNLSSTSINNPVSNSSNNIQYWLQVTDANGCSSLKADTMQLTVTPPLQAYAGPDTTIVMNQPYQLNAVLLGQPNTGLSYIWSPAFGLSNSTLVNPIATISGNQIYNVEITTQAGCKGTATVRLQVLKGPDIYVPTAFSPNGDGLNDIFRVYPVGIKQFDYLRVFNRWGQLIFETKVASKGWDAIFKGLKQPSGAYIYNVQGVTDQGKVINKKGTIILAR